MKIYISKVLFLIFCHILFLSNSSYARPENKKFSLGGTVGFPKLIALEGIFRRFDPVVFGIGVGFFPINSILQKKITVDDVALGSFFTLEPDVEYSLSSFNLFTRIYLSKTFFLEGTVSRLTATADVSADLVITSTNRVLLNNIVSGDVEAEQTAYGAAIGQEWKWGNRGYFSYSAGVTFPGSVSVNVDLSDDTASFLGVGGLLAELTSAKESLEKEIEDSIEEYQNVTPIYPYFAVGFGLAF